MNNNSLVEDLAHELDELPRQNAERLAGILQGLFSCMKELNARLERLEGRECQEGPALP